LLLPFLLLQFLLLLLLLPLLLLLQVLHYMETLSPAALFSQLLAAAVAEALSLLGRSRGAALPAAAAAVQR
jgi:hypothetical protein